MANSAEIDKEFIRLENISKTYVSGDLPIGILKNVNFSISKGEKIAVVGASGIGKSTLLHILGTLEHPDSGRLFFHGEDILSLSDERQAKIRNGKIGFVFQFHYLLPEFNAIENVMMPALIAGKDKKKAYERSYELLCRVGLDKRIRHNVVNLSGGEKQRVAIARALVMKPYIILADEPTGNLDRKNSMEVHNLLEELNKEFNTTMLVVTHNMELASLMDKQITLKEGSLVLV